MTGLPPGVDPRRVLHEVRWRREQFLSLLESLCRSESPSLDPRGQEAVHAVLAGNLEALGYAVRKLPGPRSGGHLYARPRRRVRGAPLQLLIGHYDTVWPSGTLASMPYAVEGESGRRLRNRAGFASTWTGQTILRSICLSAATSVASTSRSPARHWSTPWPWENNYTPIPYQKSCKIVAEPGWGAYFQFVYTTFPPGTTIPTFTRDLSATELAALDEAHRVLSQAGREPARRFPGETIDGQKLRVRGGSTIPVTQLQGPRAITSIRIKLPLPPSPEDRTVLRELALQIRWDGEATPSVWAPLGDFFGTAAGANRYRSLPLGLTDDGWWYSHWYMPFAKEAAVELVNDGKQRRDLNLEVAQAPLQRPIAQLARFHAKWHRDAPPVLS